ncbi:tripartite tricarboxylate transporter substrate binding protein [Ramlibacter sp. AW1]|uniref:Tripartite tricarboxylate transporter substrate binding protein n=1 Tax=Ramlibacter aurantiacus TaxID=2801330 RepID=A0A936ZQU6_9BURK|nr:tripartite tricarboxylate transporter substrate binding protein [Ramlibacter aurantiacus]MBL0421915.1 tripartite tricarboxylate transporter substrate binding protein [Ramlibacter aurantiacus]
MSSSIPRRGAILLGLSALIAAPAAMAQQYPTKPVRVIVHFSAGSGPDVAMRMVGEKLSRAWGQPVIIDNRPGASGWIGMEAAKKAPADGYTLMLSTNEQFSIQPHVFRKLPFDFDKDFEPITPVYSTHFFITASANSPWNNLNDLMAAAKGRSGQLTYGSWGTGSLGHLAGALLDQSARTEMTHVPFKELGQLYSGVANGDVSWALGSAGTTSALHQARKLKYLAIAAPQRLANYPDVPTVSESGGPPNFEARAVTGLFAPRGVPTEITDRITRDVAKALEEPDVRQKLGVMGFVPLPGNARTLADAIAADSRRYRDVSTRANILLD